MNQHARAHDVAQKLIAQSVALVRAFDEPGNIRDDETLALAVSDHTQIGHQCSKRIVGDFRAHRRDHRDQCRLAGIGQTDDADVGEQAKFDLQFALRARLARLSISAGCGWSTRRNERYPCHLARRRRPRLVRRDFSNRRAARRVADVADHRAHRNSNHIVITAPAITSSVAAALVQGSLYTPCDSVDRAMSSAAGPTRPRRRRHARRCRHRRGPRRTYFAR